MALRRPALPTQMTFDVGVLFAAPQPNLGGILRRALLHEAFQMLPAVFDDGEDGILEVNLCVRGACASDALAQAERLLYACWPHSRGYAPPPELISISASRRE